MDLPGTPPGQLTQPLTAGTHNDSDQQDIDQNKDIAAFSYLWIMSVVVYVLKRKSPFVRFHSKQAMVLFLISILVWLIPFLNHILELGVLCLMVYGFINAAQGKRLDVPIVGQLSRGEIGIRQAWKQFLDMIIHVVSMFRSEKKSGTGQSSSTPPSGSSTNSPQSSSPSSPS